ncbi:MAG: PCRF domain-containing protein, partial [Betaproteobacteria bacterium]|nr:PCRF domain-containing protein [Betaproteobacteria bacterium]
MGSTTFGGIFDYEEKKNRLEIVSAALEAPDIWNDPENAQALGKEKKALDAVVVGIEQIEQGLGDTAELFQMAQSEQDIDTFAAVSPRPCSICSIPTTTA